MHLEHAEQDGFAINQMDEKSRLITPMNYGSNKISLELQNQAKDVGNFVNTSSLHAPKDQLGEHNWTGRSKELRRLNRSILLS